ncbi:MAG: endonuclease MutS2, partial [Oscillospiraceae bacterium]|nr:endonuclease MutS2 [Oscillospiraceae bacterium]
LTCCETASQLALNLSPSSDFEEVKKEISKTNDTLSLTIRFGTPSFFNMKNPANDIKRCCAGGVLNTRELLNIALILRQMRILSEWYQQCENIPNSLEENFSLLETNRALEKKISSAIIAEDEIDDNASAELSQIRRKIKNIGMKAREHLEKMIRSSTYQKFLQEQIITMRDGRFVVPVKAEHKNDISGMVHDTSSSGATFFIEPASVVEANNEIRVLEIKEKAEIERILAELSAECAGSADIITYGFEQTIELNLYFAKANLAARMKATMPKICDNGKIFLKKARHPLIDSDKVVPINIELGDHYSSLVITGPNTGGKTVTLKTLGLLTLMTMCGLLIPVADDSLISIFDKILVDIGDEQSIEQSLSTFSAHMTNIISIIENADCFSLVLVDELGSGTDPVEGAALAISILEKLRGKGCKVAATTHYAELKVYALQTEKVENACCEFDVETLRPTYRLLIGVPGRSNAFAISKKLGLEEDILQMANKLVSTENKRFEDVVDSLEKARQGYEQKLSETEFLNRTVSQQKQELERLKSELEKQKEIEIEKARQKAQRLVDSVSLESQKLIDELENIRKEKDKADFSQMALRAKSQLKNRVGKLYDQANPVKERKDNEYVLPRPLKIGDTVLIFDIDKKGTVLSLPDKSENVMVQAGIMKIRVSMKNLRLIEDHGNYQVSGKTTRSIQSKSERVVKTEIDLRGQMVDEALMNLDMFIDNAVLSGVTHINIIHGKGTGALRAGIQQPLKKHKSIRSYRLGVFGEGENGVTIAELK